MISQHIVPSIIAAAVLHLAGVESAPMLIEDSRVRSLDMTPHFGRGYSMTTNTFQSTCLLVNAVNDPSLEYNYKYTDFPEPATDIPRLFSDSFGYPWLMENFDKIIPDAPYDFLVSSLKFERGYTTTNENVSPLSRDASTLLGKKDYVGFFKACGPSYVRSILRRQEFVGYFFFQSTNDKRGTDYKDILKLSNWGYGGRNFERGIYNAERSTMQIIIKGWGLGLSEHGSESLVARNMEDYQKALHFAYRTMARNPNPHVGMVYGIMVVPWTDNPAFNVATSFVDEVVLLPVPRSLIPKSYIGLSNPEPRCKNPLYKIDKYGYCCENGHLYNYQEKRYDSTDPDLRICRPTSRLQVDAMRNNMLANGEMVARLDRTIRYKLNQLSTLESCISSLKPLADKYEFYVLQNHLRGHNDEDDYSLENTMSVFELQLALDPFNDFGMVMHLAKELEEYMDMYVQPCYAAIFGANIGTSPDTVSNYFFAYPWYEHAECAIFECMGSNMQWDRETGQGCKPSMSTGQAPDYDVNNNNYCTKDIIGTDVKCKHDTSTMQTFKDKSEQCWSRSLRTDGFLGIDHYLDKYCMPELLSTGEKLDQGVIYDLQSNAVQYCGHGDSMNVARDKPTKQSSWYYEFRFGGNFFIDFSRWVSSNAVDGNIDGNSYRNSVTRTQYESNPWLSVDFLATYKIVKIIIYNRTDCCSQRLQGFKVILYNNGREVWSSYQSGEITRETEFDVPELDADEVKVVLEGKTEYLSIAEIVVMNKF